MSERTIECALAKEGQGCEKLSRAATFSYIYIYDRCPESSCMIDDMVSPGNLI